MYIAARPIVIQLLGHGCKDDLTTERSFDSQATWVVGIFVTYHLRVFVQPGTRGLATYASSVSFGHPEHCFFDSLDTQRFRSGFADDDNFRR